jgi:hypothetical protein
MEGWMPNASLVTACESLFSDQAAVALKLKMLLIELEEPKWTNHLSVSEFRTATEVLLACTVSNSAAGNPRRLDQAEDLCILQIQRPLKSAEAAGLHARTRFLLAFISSMRGEAEICAMNIAHSFARDPRWSRIMFPFIFETVFYPLCTEVYQEFEQDKATALARSHRYRLYVRRALAVTVGIGVGAGAAAAALGLAAVTGARSSGAAGALLARKAIAEVAGPIWAESPNQGAEDTPGSRRAASIQERHELRLDKKCSALAMEMI